MMIAEIIRENRIKISSGHYELYRTMKRKYEMNSQFEKEDLMGIYTNFVEKPSDYIPLTGSQRYNNAVSWFNRSIAILVKHGYLGLTFNVEVV